VKHERPFDYLTATGLIALHGGFLVGVVYGWVRGFYLESFILAALFAIGGSLGTTLGYHRMLTHKSFSCRSLVVRRALIFFAGLLQNASSWIANHRAHHAHADTFQDPHSPYWPYPGGIAGAWWSHMGWLFWKYQAPQHICDHADLQNADVVWENRWHAFIVTAGFILPFFLGGVIGLRKGMWSFFSYGFDSLLIAGAIRSCAILHLICSINSLGHMVGWKLKGRPTQKSSSRNNPFLALITFGEGNHAAHHQYPGSAHIGFWDPAWPLIVLGEKINIFSEIHHPREVSP
jgi:stearoyl-CoA desaturase (delta-9 desaturase)